MAYITTKCEHLILIDDDNLEKLAQYKWSINESGQAYTRINKRLTTIHRLITKCPDGYLVFHKNQRKLDNRLENLEIVTPQQYQQKRIQFQIDRGRDELGYFNPYDFNIKKEDH